MSLSRNVKHDFSRNTQPGHSTVEYALPLAIIGLVVFLAVGGMTPLFSGFIGKSLGQKNGVSANPTSRILVVPQLGSNPLGQPAVFTLADGTQIQLSQFPTNLQQSVESVGSNGTTDLLANTLKELAQKLKEAGKIDETQFQNLIDLSNLGHSLGNLQGQVEVALEKTITSNGTFRDQIIQYKGLNLSPGSFAQLLGITVSDPKFDQSGVGLYLKKLTPVDVQFNKDFYSGTYNLIGNNTFVGEDRYAFYQQLQKTAQSGALKDENVKNLVKSLTSNIEYLTQLNGSATYLLSSGHQTSDGITIGNTNDFKTFISQRVADTHVDSKSICLLGNGKDNTQSCKN